MMAIEMIQKGFASSCSSFHFVPELPRKILHMSIVLKQEASLLADIVQAPASHEGLVGHVNIETARLPAVPSFEVVEPLQSPCLQV